MTRLDKAVAWVFGLMMLAVALAPGFIIEFHILPYLK